jgi:ABC-type transporter Mla maintaining outer membrane lipid asymmetry ATPase subunit MlaF
LRQTIRVPNIHGLDIVLFQNAARFDFLMLYDNLALPLRRLTRKSEQEIDEIIDRVLHQVGLGGDREKIPLELSGGMKKRAGLARALVVEPEILMVDEPSSGLDRITASEIEDLLIEMGNPAPMDSHSFPVRRLRPAATPGGLEAH